MLSNLGTTLIHTAKLLGGIIIDIFSVPRTRAVTVLLVSKFLFGKHGLLSLVSVLQILELIYNYNVTAIKPSLPLYIYGQLKKHFSSS